MDLKQIELMREDPALLKTFEPRIEVAFALEKGAAVFRVSDTGGGVDPEQLPLMFQKPLPSKKRAQKSFGQGTIFVKFFGESMGFDNPGGEQRPPRRTRTLGVHPHSRSAQGFPVRGRLTGVPSPPPPFPGTARATKLPP